MSKGAHWMPLFVGDYLRDTGHLTAAEHGAYLLLLMHAWSRDGLLPLDEERLRTMARMDRKGWAKSRETVLSFFMKTHEGYRNARVDRELSASQVISKTRRDAGIIGAAKRWKTNETPMANATDLPMAKRCPPQPQPQEEINPPSPSESVPPTARRGSRLAADWMPGPDERAFAESLGLDPDKIAASFRDYWHAATGSNATKANWPATWRNWCRRDAERQPRAFAPQPARKSVLSEWHDLLNPQTPAFDFDATAEEITH